MRATIVAGVFLFALNGGLWAQFDCDGVPTVPGEDIELELVVTGFTRPIDLQAAPGDDTRLYVVEQRGTVQVIDLATETVTSEFLDIDIRVDSTESELGLLGLAFHPNFQENGFFFVNYTRDGSSSSDGCGRQYKETVIARFHARSPDDADEGSEAILLTADQPFWNHNAGQLAFHPESGYLYIGMGDGGSGGDPCNSGQLPNTLLGKMLRIDVDATDRGFYGIPQGNRYAASDDGVPDEIWSFGVRNPWRFSFDPGTPTGERRGDIYIADVGQNQREEVSYADGSANDINYGWRRFEGNRLNSSGTSLDGNSTTHTAPVVEYLHGFGSLVGNSITGGVVYRGCRMPDLHGTYFYADYTSDWVATTRVSDEGVASQPVDITGALNASIPGNLNRISSFGTDTRGEVYIVELDGRVFRVIPSNPPLPEFRRGDSNGSGTVLLDDVVVTLMCLFLSSDCPECLDAADADDNGLVDIVDPLRTAFYLFGLSDPPPAPGPTECGAEETFLDDVGCVSYPACP